MYLVKFRGKGWIDEWKSEEKPIIVADGKLCEFKQKGKLVIITWPFSVEEI